MTPTEQDKELEAQLDKIFPCNCSFMKGFAFRPGDPCDGSCVNAPYKKAVLQLITADRKRVALKEWDIANEAVLKNAQVISDEQEKLEALALVDPKKHNDKIGSYMDRAFGFDLAFQPFAEARRKRIAELKAQQEKE